MDRGIDIWFRPQIYSLHKRAWRKLTMPEKSFEALEVRRLIRAKSPDLVVLSDGNALPPIDVMELCIAQGLPFVTIAEANCDL